MELWIMLLKQWEQYYAKVHPKSKKGVQIYVMKRMVTLQASYYFSTIGYFAIRKLWAQNAAQLCLSKNFSIKTENAAKPAQPAQAAFGPPEINTQYKMRYGILGSYQKGIWKR